MIDFNFDKFAKEALTAVGDFLVSKAQGNMDKVSFGRVYIVNGRKHIASRAGDAPNNMTGALRRTVRYEIHGDVLEFGAGNSRVNYAKFLERGTSRMGKRPNYTKTILDNKKEIGEKIEDALVNNIRWHK